jgi:putative transposase
VKINGVQPYLWRAVDHEGEVLEAYVSKTRDRRAALKFLRKLMKRHGRPDELVTDGVKSYGAALREIGAEDRQVTGRWENNRAENFGNGALAVKRRLPRGFGPSDACRTGRTGGGGALVGCAAMRWV